MLMREWTLATDVQGIPLVVEEVVALCRAAGFSARQCQLNVPVAVSEALANAMLRGNSNEPSRRVLLAVVLTDDELTVDVTDEGPGFDLGALQQSPDDPDWFTREHGRGVYLMRSLMDRVESRRDDARHGHRLRLQLRRA